ncbi:hypothetical protein [Thalassiella azotivora]
MLPVPSVVAVARDPLGAVGALATVAGATVGGVLGAVSTAAGLVPRTADLLTRTATLVATAETLVARVDGLLDALDLLLVRVEAVVDQAQETALDAGGVVSRSDAAARRAADLLGTGDAVLTKADRLVEGGSGLLHRGDHLLGTLTPLGEELLPVLRRVAESLSPDEVDAAVALLDRLPVLLAHLDEDVLPMLRQLDRVGPDVHAILEVVDDLRDVVLGLPGVGLLKRMGDEKD